jgi:hypothetical protein
MDAPEKSDYLHSSKKNFDTSVEIASLLGFAASK